MQTEILCKEPFIMTMDGFLTPAECQSFIDASESVGYEEAPITTAQGFVMRKDVRNNLRLIVDDFALAESLFHLAAPYLPEQIREWHLLGFNERMRHYRYDEGQTFKPHYDGQFSRSGEEISLVTFMLYLNDNFQGGETRFYYDDTRPRLSVVPKQGMALAFKHQQLHEGAPVESGRKYVLRTDVMYQWRGGFG